MKKLHTFEEFLNESQLNEAKAKTLSPREIIGKPIKIGKLEIAENDFPKEMKWPVCIESCDNLGDGWRLPTIEELQIMYENKEKIGGFQTKEGQDQPSSCYYWSSTEVDEKKAKYIHFFEGMTGDSYKKAMYFNARAVRSI